MSAEQDRLAAFAARLGHRFADPALLHRALTHASFDEGRGQVLDNERLEFLGDRVLGLLAARHLFLDNKNANEGQMARRLNALVCKEACARAARRADIGASLRLSRAEEKNGGRDKTSILGDVCEAVMAALYLDGGMDAAAHFFEKFWGDELEDKGQYKDPKSTLQEWAQQYGFGLPEYKEVDRSGPDHSPVFTVCVTAGPHTATASGQSKQGAERDAAALLLAQGTHDR